jgi:hypothetical protein
MFVWMVKAGDPAWWKAVERLEGGKKCVDAAKTFWNTAGEACKPSAYQRLALRLVRAKHALLAFLLLLLPLRLMLVLLRRIELAECEPLLLEARYGFVCDALTRPLTRRLDLGSLS